MELSAVFTLVQGPNNPLCICQDHVQGRVIARPFLLYNYCMKYGDLVDWLDTLSNLIVDIKPYYNLTEKELADQRLLERIVGIIELPLNCIDDDGTEDDLFVDIGELFVMADGHNDTSQMLNNYRINNIQPEINSIKTSLIQKQNTCLPSEAQKAITIARQKLATLKATYPRNSQVIKTNRLCDLTI